MGKRHHPPPAELLWLLESHCDITGGGRSWGHRMLRAHLMANSGIRPTLEAVLAVQRAHDPAASQARLERLIRRGAYTEDRAMRVWHMDSASCLHPACAVCLFDILMASAWPGSRVTRLWFQRNNIALSRWLLTQLSQFTSTDRLFHIAAYDKLKAYGMYIHGIVDGGTNRVMAMTVACNKTEQAVSYGYFEACREHGRPMKIRVDMAWEAAGVGADISAYRGHGSHLVGPSTANQVCGSDPLSLEPCSLHARAPCRL